MKRLGDRVFIKTGESFTLKFGDTDEVPPLVLTDTLMYPFITCSIRSTVYPQASQYVNVKWLDCQNVIRFEESDIFNLGLGDMNSVVLPIDDKGPVNGVYKRVYCVHNASFEQTYFYRSSTNSTNNRSQYQFKFKVEYSNTENVLVDRSYVAELQLVDGMTTYDRLKQLCVKYNITLTDDTMHNALQALKNIGATELKSMDVNEPLSALTLVVPLYQFEIFVEV